MTWCDHQDAEADCFRQIGCQADGAGSYYVSAGWRLERQRSSRSIQAK